MTHPFYVIVTGGVLSGLGKGVTTASLGAVFRMMGLTCTLKKLDPYLNVDPGTMNPVEHGEVFVTDDGAETDLDIGYYERFAEIRASKFNSTSSGQVFQTLLDRERKGDFLGKTVQMVPHFTDELQAFIERDSHQYDVVLCEIGGSVGDVEAMAFYEALCRLRAKVGIQHFILVHLVYIVHYQASNEFKTKPAQNAIRDLMRTGLTPDVVMCRFEHPSITALPEETKQKLQQHCSCVVDMPNVSSIYQLPLRLVEQKLPCFFTHRFGLAVERPLQLERWQQLHDSLSLTKNSHKKPIRIALVGKYVTLHDAYCSLVEAIFHSSLTKGILRPVEYIWVDARALEERLKTMTKDAGQLHVRQVLSEADAMLLPGGFGATGLHAMMACLHEARTSDLPTLGICLGMQLMVVEWMRHVVGRAHASSHEWLEASAEKTDHLVKEHMVIGPLEELDNTKLGGTMRLGRHTVSIRPGSRAQTIYGKNNEVFERHRHRYEVQPECVPQLEKSGLRISGHREGLVEIVERADEESSFYVGCQFHPEYTSSPFAPHPLITSWLRAASSYAQ